MHDCRVISDYLVSVFRHKKENKIICITELGISETGSFSNTLVDLNGVNTCFTEPNGMIAFASSTRKHFNIYSSLGGREGNGEGVPVAPPP